MAKSKNLTTPRLGVGSGGHGRPGGGERTAQGAGSVESTAGKRQRPGGGERTPARATGHRGPGRPGGGEKAGR